MNNLEVLLSEAFTDTTLRVQFYSLLMESNVFVVYHSSDTEIIDGTLKKGQKVTLAGLKRSDGENVIPFFTSEEAMKRVITTEVKYLKINGKEFLDMIKGSEAVLNPFLENAKEFSVGEINALLEGFEPQEIHEQQPVREMISQHEKNPDKLIDSLKGYFSTDKRIKKGYIALYDNTVLEKDLKTLIIVECSGGYEEIKKEIIDYSNKNNDSGYTIEVMKYESGKNLCEIVENRYSPFYIKKFLGIF